MRKITYYSVMTGVLSCTLAAIWSPEEAIKWMLSAVYLALVGKYFGLTFRSERIEGEVLKRPFKELNFLNMRKR